MFSNYYHLGNTIELFNLQNKNLCSKWHFEGKYSKLFDPSLKCYEMILSTGNLSKMLIPKVKKNSKIKTLSLFQGYVVFQLYLFTSKQFSIELAISDTTNAKRRLIFSSNNDNLVINQLHCRIPIFELPIGKWINLSIDILSFVSECFKNLTFRSVDFISLSMSGKVRYIFTMRTPLIDNITQMEGEEKNDYDLDDCGNKISDNSGNSSFIYGAKDIPDKYKFPDSEKPININMNCNYVLQQITLQNQIKQLSYQQKLILNSDPILIQDTADASNMDKGLKFRHNIFLQNKKKMKKFRRYPFEENFFENPFNNYNNNIEFDNGYGYGYVLDNNLMENNMNMNMNNDYHRHRQLSDGALINENGSSNYYNNNNIMNNNNVMNVKGQNQSTERFKNIGNLIVSQDNNNNLFNPYKNDINDNYKNNADENKIIIQQEDGYFKNNRYGSYNSLKYSRENNNDEGDKHKFIFFNKDEYNKLYNSGKGSAEQITHNLHMNEKNINNDNNNNNNNNNNNEIDEKYNYQLSTIKNENANSNNSELVEEEKKNYIGQILEDSLNLINNSQNNEFLSNNNNKGNNNVDNNNNNNNNKGEQRPFSPPITKIDDAEEQENLL
jgi:hypothetical protein